MKKLSKEIKIVTAIVILTIVFLLGLTGVYTYFTVTDNINHDFSLYNLELRFDVGGSSYIAPISITEDGVTFNQYQLDLASSISRGEYQLLKYNDITVNSVQIYTTSDSCPSFVRFWLDAYIVENGQEDTSTNYGKYFRVGREVSSNFADSVSIVYSTSSNVATYGETKVDNTIYYLANQFGGGDQDENLTLFSRIKLLEDADSNILGKTLHLYVNFEAVQANNDAYLSEFNDSYGYLNSWEF